MSANKYPCCLRRRFFLGRLRIGWGRSGPWGGVSRRHRLWRTRCGPRWARAAWTSSSSTGARYCLLIGQRPARGRGVLRWLGSRYAPRSRRPSCLPRAAYLHGPFLFVRLSHLPAAGSIATQVTISNDGATIMRLLEIVHPAAKTLVDISMSQVPPPPGRENM